MTKQLTFDKFYEDHALQYSSSKIMLSSDGMKILIGGAMDGRVDHKNIKELLLKCELVDFAIGAIYEIEDVFTNQCHMYCKYINECNVLKSSAVAVRLIMRGSRSDEYLCMSCTDRGLVVPYTSTSLMKTLVEACLELPAAKSGMSAAQAYEVNKYRETCVLCGKRTEKRPIMFSVINYCPCIEQTT